MYGRPRPSSPKYGSEALFSKIELRLNMDNPAGETKANGLTSGSAATVHVSLEGMHGTVDVPHHQAGFWQQWRAFIGPAILVSVGYMDPGNWGKDLAQCCRDWYPNWSRWPNWLLCEGAIGACDLAEVLGSAVAINLMFHIPLLWAVVITGLDVLLLLSLQGLGMRAIEAMVLLLIVTIGVCYLIEIFVLPQTQPDLLEMGKALVTPTL